MEWVADKLNASLYKVEHTSDVLRCAILWRFGGTYLDTDMIVLREFPKVSKAPNIVSQVRDSKSFDDGNFSKVHCCF